MRETYFEVVYDLKDTTALEDSTPSTLDNIAFANEYLLKNNAPFPKYATVEQDYFLLDGSFEEFPDSTESVNIPFWTSTISDENGDFAEHPVLTILFSENHTSTGLTFHFVEDYPLLMAIRWYDLNGEMISAQAYEVDSLDYYARNLVENYGRLEIEFYKAKPYRYVKLYGIDYGVVVTWSKDSLKNGSLTEDIDPISSTLKINKLDFQFVDLENEFDLSDSTGLHRSLQKKQHIAPYEYINGEKIFLGRYFLSSQETSKNIVKISAVDYIGLMDDTDFKDGRVYNGEPAGNVIDDIFAGTGIPYEVAEDVAEIPLYGWLKIQTRRNAMKEVLFACNAIAETAQRDNVLIRANNQRITQTVGRDRKFSTSVKKDEYISEINIKISEYTAGTEEKEIVKAATYPAGRNEVKFNSPISDLRISAGEIIDQKTNYVVFSLPEESEVTIYGKQYEKQDITATANIAHLDAGENPKAKSYTNTLLNFKRAREIAQKILDYYQTDMILNIKYLANGERVADWVAVENTLVGRGGYAAQLESMNTDLTGGYITTAKLRGSYKYSPNYYRAGEIYADEDIEGVLI